MFSRRGQKKRKSILPAFLAPLVRGAGAAGDWGVVTTFFLSLSLADAWQLPRQREPRKQKRLFSRRSQESENIRLAEKPILILTNFPYFLQKLLTQALGYAKITKKVNIVLLPAGKKKTPADLLSWNSTSPDKLCANTHNYQPDFRHRREASITYLTKHCKCYTSFWKWFVFICANECCRRVGWVILFSKRTEWMCLSRICSVFCFLATSLSAFLAPLVRGAVTAGDWGVVFLSLSLANAQQLPRQREPRKPKRSFSRGSQKKRKSVSCLAEGAGKLKSLVFYRKKINRYKITDILYFYIEYTSKK